MVENEILSRWKEYFEDLLNPVKASTCDTHEMTHSRENAAGVDEIRPEMLKALTGEGILRFTRVCEVAVWQNSQRLANRCDYFDIQKRRSLAMYKLQRDIIPKFARESICQMS